MSYETLKRWPAASRSAREATKDVLWDEWEDFCVQHGVSRDTFMLGVDSETSDSTGAYIEVEVGRDGIATGMSARVRPGMMVSHHRCVGDPWGRCAHVASDSSSSSSSESPSQESWEEEVHVRGRPPESDPDDSDN